MRVSDGVRDALAAEFAGVVDAGSGDPVVQVWSGTAPGSIGGSPGGVLLLEFDLTGGFSSDGTGRQAAGGVPLAAEGLADGTAGYARVLDGDGVAVADTESVSTSSAEVVLSSLSVSTGADFSLLSCVFVQSGGSV